MARIARNNVYLDFAAATPLARDVRRVMDSAHRRLFANPLSIHASGRDARAGFLRARKAVARELGVKPAEVIFTSGGTESNNLALLGVLRAHNARRGARGKKRARPPRELVISSVEHASVEEPARALASEGVLCNMVEADECGYVSPDAVLRLLGPHTVLVSVMLVNNELGTKEPVKEISTAIRRFRARTRSPRPYLHVDASQAPRFLAVRPHDIGADLVTLDGAKIYGPKGAGVLVVRGEVPIEPLFYGGGHEQGVRSGTQSVAAALGFARALQYVGERRARENKRMSGLKSYFLKRLRAEAPEVLFIGDPRHTVSGIINFAFPHVNAEALLIAFDVRGVAVSAGSACSSVEGETYSRVVAHLRGRERFKDKSIRVSFGEETNKKDIDYFFRVLPGALRAAGKGGRGS